MHCPHCIEELKIAERQGIEIDYCPHCRGVWLDRGELDKIIERTIAAHAPPSAAPRDVEPPSDPQYRGKPSKKGKKKQVYRSILEEIFDF